MGKKTANRRQARGGCATTLLTLCACLLLTHVATAAAAYDPVSSGTTKLSLEKSFLALLKQNGVKLAGAEGAKVSGAVVDFTVNGGKLDPTDGKGTVEHGGALVFKAGGKSIPLKALQLKTTSKNTPFSAKVGGSQLKIAAAKGLTGARQGFGFEVRVTKLSLSAKLATRLGKKLGLRGVFKAGQPLGSTVTKTAPATVTVLGQGRASLTPDPAFLAKCNELFVALNPIFPAEHIGTQFTFPIFGGTISPSASSGAVETQGALELIQLFGGQVFLHEPWAELGATTLSAESEIDPSPPYPGKQGRQPSATLSLAGATVSADPKARTVSVQGAAATIGAGLATSLNEVFAKPKGKGEVFRAGEALGTLSFVAQGQ